MFLFLLWFAVLCCAYLFCVCSLRFWYSSASDNKHTHLFFNNTNIWQVRGAPCTFIELYEIEQSLSCLQCNELKQRNRFKLKNTFNFFWNAQLRNYRSKSRAILQKRKKTKKKKKQLSNRTQRQICNFEVQLQDVHPFAVDCTKKKMHPMQKEQTVFFRKKEQKICILFHLQSVWMETSECGAHERPNVHLHRHKFTFARSYIHTLAFVFSNTISYSHTRSHIHN